MKRDHDDRRRVGIVISHLAGSRRGAIQRFEQETVLLGRGSHNDIAYDLFDDATVSSQHAEVRVEGPSFVLYDMGSLNGTLLNGIRVRRAELRAGDEIRLGSRGPRLRFTSDEQLNGDPDATPVMARPRVEISTSVGIPDLKATPTPPRPAVEPPPEVIEDHRTVSDAPSTAMEMPIVYEALEEPRKEPVDRVVMIGIYMLVGILALDIVINLCRLLF